MSKMLSSWKEIAHFFGKGVRTVQRWEKTLDLPIHRPPGAPSNVVLARTSDLEEWMHRGPVSRAELEAATPAAEIVSLSSLEREVTHLAQAHGVAVDELQDAETTDDRVTALTGILARVNTRMGNSAVRAA